MTTTAIATTLLSNLGCKDLAFDTLHSLVLWVGCRQTSHRAKERTASNDAHHQRVDARRLLRTCSRTVADSP